MSTEEVDPLIIFFRAVMAVLKKQLPPAEFQEILEEYSTERDVGIHATPTPGQTSSPGD